MQAKVKLITRAEGFQETEFSFSHRTTCILGRSPECHIRIPEDVRTRKVSRFHCMIDINPPEISIRDFGSLNGTFINGEFIGRRQSDQSSTTAERQLNPTHPLVDGDQIKIANFILTVHVEESIQMTAQERNNEDVTDIETFGSTLSTNHRVPVSRHDTDLQAFKRLLTGGIQNNFELDQIDGYTLLEELGAGGMGMVYLARNQSNQTTDVVKIIHPKVRFSEWHARSFLREARNTGSLRHKNIVEVRSFGRTGESFFLILEYCNYGSLAELVKSRRLQPKPAIAMTRQILAGLDYAHSADIRNVKLADGNVGRGTGLVHRDLCPDNVLLQRSNGRICAKIADFGLSKAFDLAGLSGFTKTGMYAGKPKFTCRQQVLNYRTCTPEVDVWAAAACLYHSLTGSYPRHFHEDKDDWLVVLEEKPVKVRNRDAGIPGRLANLIDLALDDHADLYFHTAAEFDEALSKCKY